MKTFKIQHDCGCCFSEAQFKSRESAEAAFAKAGLGNDRIIQDDAGNRFTGIDTFYGVMEKDEDTSSPLLRLAAKLNR